MMFASSCVIHNEFPFICFEKGCVNNNIDIKGFKKRVKGKIAIMKRKLKRRSVPENNDKFDHKIADSRKSQEETPAAKGKNVDYFPYLILLRLKDNPNQMDSNVVMHTNEFNDLIPVDKSRMIYRIDTIKPKNILMVYIKKYYNPELDKNEPVHVQYGRVKALKKFLIKQGIHASHVKILQDSLSPPRL